ncbi:ABC transporter substrate-binding protein [Marinivivus vitaminiproducens]|uniref:ABC transporter substrate-binding protein n=1 Tax=Marinivivus vitaminiproducens TaxID=3035935 RepID=UPI0027A8815F|nr:ABC transporter substrate-binding protein [Geminicoccaceae bacterium SCSIO 64248]
MRTPRIDAMTLRRPIMAASVLGLALGVPQVGHAATPPTALVMAWNIDAISTWDPAQIGEVVTNELVQNTCDALVDFDPSDPTKVQPLFATSWDVSEDRKQITFHLQEGATFPSGNEATAEDVAWSMHRVVKLGFGNAATLTEYGFTEDNVEDMIQAVDDTTLVMKLDKPYPTDLILQAVAANRVAAVLDSEEIMANEEDGDLGNKYLTTRTECIGPYRLVRWNAGEGIMLEANEDYYGEAPALSRVVIRHVAEPGTQRLLLTQGDVDVARDLTPEDLADLEQSPDITIAKALKPQLFYWNMNNAYEPLSNPKVRLALRYLIDYQGLGETVMRYSGAPRASFVQIGAFGALDEKAGQPFGVDLEKAKQLLTEAGYADGFEMSVLFGTLPYSAPIAQSVQQNASKVGIKLNLERMANAQLFSRVRGREFQSTMQSWQTSVPDAHGMASRQIYNPDNSAEAKLTQYPSWRASWYSEEANAKVDAALMEPDTAKREQMYHDLQEEMLQDGPQGFMFQIYDVAGVRNELKGWAWNGFRVYYENTSK